MFGQTVVTAFVGEIADELFPKIRVGNSYADDSFVGTARAILAPRIPADFDREVIVDFMDRSTCIQLDADDIFGGFDEGREYFRLVAVSSEFDDVAFAQLAESVEARKPSFQQDMKVKAFFGQFSPKINIASYIDAQNHHTVVVASGVNIRTYHAIQTALPRFFPWFFAESKVNADERALLLSLCNRSPHTQTVHGTDGTDTVKPGYIELMQACEKFYDFKTAKIMKMIPTFIANSEQVQIDNVIADMRRLDDQYESYESMLRDINTQRHDLEVRLAGLNVMRGHGDDGGLTEWFKSVDQVELTDARDGRLNFEVYTNLEWWDDDLAVEYVRNRESEMYSRTAGMKKDSWEILMRAIFVDRTMHIRTCAAYSMRIGDTIAGMSGHTFTRDSDTRIPNSHIQYHGCTGAYRSMFRDAMKRGEYVLGMETAVTSAKSMNFSDISFGEFIRDMGDNKDKRYIEDNDGNLYTPGDAVKQIKKLAKEAAK